MFRKVEKKEKGPCRKGEKLTGDRRASSVRTWRRAVVCPARCPGEAGRAPALIRAEQVNARATVVAGVAAIGGGSCLAGGLDGLRRLTVVATKAASARALVLPEDFRTNAAVAA